MSVDGKAVRGAKATDETMPHLVAAKDRPRDRGFDAGRSLAPGLVPTVIAGRLPQAIRDANRSKFPKSLL
jgi:hypothetical protein